MKNGILMMFISQLLALLSPEMIKKTLDSALNFLETKIAETTNEYDDATILPVIKMIRTTLGIIDGNSENYAQIKSNTGQMLNQLLSGLLMYLSPELIKGFIDTGLDVVENMVAASDTKMDDVLIIPRLSR